MLQYFNHDFLLEADWIHLTNFANNNSVEFTSDNIRFVNSTSGDDALILSKYDSYGNHTDPSGLMTASATTTNLTSEIRLIIISPENDWRTNTTYKWKLSSAWMLLPYDNEMEEETSSSYAFWNIENYIDSEIKGTVSNENIFICDYVELDFWSLKRDLRDAIQDHPLAKLVMSGVKLGAYVQPSAEIIMSKSASRWHANNSQSSNSNCKIINGEYSSTFTNENNSSTGYCSSCGTWIPFFVCILVAICLIYTWHVMCRNKRRKLYDEIIPSSIEQHDLALEEDGGETTNEDRENKKPTVEYQ